jgi:hypothetical protein
MTSHSLRRLAAATFAVLLCGVASACRGKPSTAPGFPDGRTRVLFIGNSLTYTNNLPSMYLALARQAGNDSVVAAQITFPDYALEDHWAEGSARRSLQTSRWEYVIMQQGSSALPASQLHLRTWAEQFAPLVRAAGAQPVMFMVWPTSGRVFDFPNVLQSYRDAAASIGGIFAPAGDAWTAHGALESLYSDGLHPSVRGTYIAALVLLERTLNIQPEQLPASVPGVPSIAEAEVRAMQQAARVALQRNVSRPSNRQVPQ